MNASKLAYSADASHCDLLLKLIAIACHRSHWPGHGLSNF